MSPRRKCVLLMHTGTFFPVLVVDVSKRDLRDLGSWVTSAIEAAFAAERLGPGTLGPLEPASLLWPAPRAAACSDS